MFNKYVLNNYICICVYMYTQTHRYTYNHSRLICILDHQKSTIYPQAGEDACEFLGSRDAKTEEPLTCLVDEMFSQPQDFLHFAAHSAVLMPILIFLLLNFSGSNIYSS